MSDQEQERDPLARALDEVFGQVGAEVPPTALELACGAEIHDLRYQPWDYRRYTDMDDLLHNTSTYQEARAVLREGLRQIERLAEFQQTLAFGAVAHEYRRANAR